MNPDAVNSLREAVRVSPDNLPLRRALADMLLGMGKPEEAEKEFRHALSLSPHDANLKVGLATAFHQQGKSSAAMVIVEDLVKSPDAPPRARILFARLLFKAGDVERAVYQYKQAVEADASAA